MIEKIIIDEEFKSLIPPLAEDEYTQLEENILREGIREPLVVWDHILIDGHNRYAIAKKHDLQCSVVAYSFASRNDVIIWMAKNQFGRRNISHYDRAKLALRLEHIFKEMAVENQKSALKQNQTVGQNSAQRTTGDYEQSKTKERLAKIADVSHDTITKVKKIESNGDAELKKKLQAGDMSINEAYNQIKKKEVLKRLTENNSKKSMDALNELPQLYFEDCRERLKAIENSSIDLIFTDPPYSTHIKDMDSFLSSWLPTLLDKLKPTGRAFICTGPYPEEQFIYLKYLLSDGRFDVLTPLIWVYKNRIGPTSKDYKNNYQVIHHIVGNDAPEINCEVLLEKLTVQEFNAPDGRHGNYYHAWQKPDDLADRLILQTTQSKQVVFDPFAGTGTFLLSASRLGRYAYGCENKEEMITIARNRGCEIISKN